MSLDSKEDYYDGILYKDSSNNKLIFSDINKCIKFENASIQDSTSDKAITNYENNDNYKNISDEFIKKLNLNDTDNLTYIDTKPCMFAEYQNNEGETVTDVLKVQVQYDYNVTDDIECVGSLPGLDVFF